MVSWSSSDGNQQYFRHCTNRPGSYCIFSNPLWFPGHDSFIFFPPWAEWFWIWKVIDLIGQAYLANMKSISNSFIISPHINVYIIVTLHANKLVNNQGMRWFFMCKREKRKERVQCTRHQGPGTRGLDSRISASSAMRNLGSHFNGTGFGDMSLHVGSRMCALHKFRMHYI
jgi:hypothetical protein